MLALRDAAALAGVSKSSLFRSIRAGRLSATRTDAGEFRVDPAEIARVYSKDVVSLRGRRAPAEQGDTPSTVSPESDAIRLARAEARLEALERETRLLREVAENFKAERDAWKGQAERLALAPPRGRSWWPWGAGRLSA